MEPTGMTWRKSTYSSGGSTNCVEAANIPGTVLVRDTKQEGRRNRVTLSVPAGAWHRFVSEIKR